MTIQELQEKLIIAYQPENLNKLTFTVINMFKNEKFNKLQEIAEIVNEYVPLEIKKDGKGFSKFMMLYHPDRAAFHLAEINRLVNENKYEELLSYSHILNLENIEEITTSVCNYEDIDYSPAYSWDINSDGFSRVKNKKDKKTSKHKKTYYSFYDAVKIRVYGNIKVYYPSYYLEDYEEFELASSNINNLDGIQYCTHVKTLDLSDNEIFDLSFLSNLKQIESLNLSYNKICYIDSLLHLKKLKILDLSNNKINDISPILYLNNLEYVNLTGNSLNLNQIQELKDNEVLVEF